jgi:DNA primase
MNNTYIANEIKKRIKMPELLQFYGFDIKRGRMKCPLHNGEDYNCGVKENYIHCFVCDESANVITFIIKYYGLSFKEAITKLNNDFNLGLPIGEKLDRRKQIDIAKKSFQARQEREKQQKEHNRLKNARKIALDKWVRLDTQKTKYKPKSLNEVLHPLFVEAIMNLPYAKYRLECAETELYLYETRNRCNT